MSNIIRHFISCLRRHGNERISKPIIASSDLSSLSVQGYPVRPDPFDSGQACAECGGYFVPQFLTPASHGRVIKFEDGKLGLPSFRTVYYCKSCEPVAPIVFELLDGKGTVLDTRCLDVSDGWLQDIDQDTGENQHLLSPDEYDLVTCDKCGQFIEESMCADCRPEPELKPKTKSRRD